WRWGITALLALYPAALLYGYGYVYGLLPLWGVSLQNAGVSFSWTEFVGVMSMYYLHLTVYAALIKAVRQTYASRKNRQRAEGERDALRDKLLRFQINGHFQSNVLNVIASRAMDNGDYPT